MFETSAKLDDSAIKLFLQNITKNMVFTSVDRLAKVSSAIVPGDIFRHFEQQSGPDGKWVKWSPAYAKRSRALGFRQILMRTGALRANVKPNNYTKTNNGVMWFNNAKTSKGFPYAAAHDNGGPVLPQRKFMWVSQDAMERIAKAYLVGIEK